MPCVDIYHLPTPTTPLVGRVEELALLDRAFADNGATIVALIAAGGIGKSALADEWLRRLKQRDWNGVERVFGWSFYSQGTHDTQTSSASFFNEALPFFGCAQALSLTDDVQKGRALAAALQQQPAILVLDGVEPLQHRADIQRGEFKDVGLNSLLRAVAKNGLVPHSLVLLSSRQPVVELSNFVGRGYQPVDLQTLNLPDGVALLKRLHVQGLKAELEAAVKAYGGHALALVLLGNFLTEYCNGDVNQHHRLPLLEGDQYDPNARQTLRVLHFYDQECWPADAPERIFLRLLGLFDRPMGQPELTALLERAEIARPLKNLPDNDWQQMLVRLRHVGLLLGIHPLTPSLWKREGAGVSSPSTPTR